jgi:hypothetical protein
MEGERKVVVMPVSANLEGSACVERKKLGSFLLKKERKKDLYFLNTAYTNKPMFTESDVLKNICR